MISNPTGVLPIHQEDQGNFFLCASMILDLLWKIRNSASFKNQTFSLSEAMSTLNLKIQEAKLQLGEIRQTLVSSIDGLLGVSPPLIALELTQMQP